MRDSTKESMENTIRESIRNTKRMSMRIQPELIRNTTSLGETQQGILEKKTTIGCIEHSLVYFLWLTFPGRFSLVNFG